MREFQDFLSKFFCLTVPKNFVGEPFCAVFQKISGGGKFMDKRGGGRIKIFHQKISVPQCRKTSQENFSVLCFIIFSGSEKDYE